MKLFRMRPLSCFLMVFILPALLGSVLIANEAVPPPAKADTESDALRLFGSMLVMVEENYATKVDSEKAVFGAIEGMLRTLDPHSKFLEPRSFRALREDQTGTYAGLGIQVSAQFGKVTIVSHPFPDSPAEKAGLHVGDMITQVDGLSTQGLNVDEVVSKLRGRPGTSVKVTISRPGVEKSFEVSIVRQQLKKYTINYSYMIRPRVGYIKIDSFAETTGAELKDTLRKMNPGALDGLLLDLRGNPGGLLQEAIKVGEAFLQRDQLILKTDGRTNGSAQQYPAKQRNTDPLYPLVVLVDQNSASASEIVSGAIQDHDRGLIVGDTTFGKGLVQSVYTLRNNSGIDAGLLLTTQKWYTPSGRLIQRDYSTISQFDYMYHRDAAADTKKKEVKYSDNGRIVYGGGGITPDVIVPRHKYNAFERAVSEKYAFVSFGLDFLAKNPTVGPAFEVGEAMMGDFRKHLTERQVEFTDKDFTENLDFIKTRIKHEIFYKRLGAAEAQKVLNEADPQIKRAIEMLPEAKKLQEKTNRQIAKQ